MSKILKSLNRFLATGFFIGEIPGAPGTYGSILAILFLLFLPFLNKIYFIILFILIATGISYLEELNTGVKDDPKIVIDEIAGIFVTFVFLELNFIILFLGFILFRIFDIFKPYVIDKVQKLPYGIGVMADDILAGFFSWIILNLIIIFLF
ncbi:MAG: phosphatidylglycerophosphatase A family protein [Bacillota bacterium]